MPGSVPVIRPPLPRTSNSKQVLPPVPIGIEVPVQATATGAKPPQLIGVPGQHLAITAVDPIPRQPVQVSNRVVQLTRIELAARQSGLKLPQFPGNIIEAPAVATLGARPLRSPIHIGCNSVNHRLLTAARISELSLLRVAVITILCKRRASGN